MPLTAYSRLRMLWGALDWQAGSPVPYSTAQTLSGGTSAVASGGIGVRRCILVIGRTTAHSGADVAECHFDFLNITSGAPDDTWITSDFTTLEGYIDTFWTTVKQYVSPGYQLQEYRWYRVGAGVVKPNPAVRVLTKTVPVVGTGTSNLLPPQVACSLTFRTAVRRSWGRTYLPLTGVALAAGEVFGTSLVSTVAGAANTLLTSAAGSDFVQVVTSLHLNAALAVEQVEVDNVPDIIRRRRWKQQSARTILP
jgi:hypothetical protein